jgi:hypothetical protein
MLLPPIARGEVERRRRIGATERPIVTHIGPDPPGVGLALGQDGYRRVVGMQALGSQDVAAIKTCSGASAIVAAPI